MRVFNYHRKRLRIPQSSVKPTEDNCIEKLIVEILFSESFKCFAMFLISFILDCRATFEII